MLRFRYIRDAVFFAAKEKQETAAYRLYCAECLRVISENTARSVGGSFMTISFEDIMRRPANDPRSAKEIVEEIARKCGLEVIKSHEPT